MCSIIRSSRIQTRVSATPISDRNGQDGSRVGEVLPSERKVEVAIARRGFRCVQSSVLHESRHGSRRLQFQIGTDKTDLALEKYFLLNEKLRLQLRAEAFDVFNHPFFTNPDTGLGDSNFRSERTRRISRWRSTSF